MRGSRLRFLAFLAALAAGVSAFGGFVLPRLGADPPAESALISEQARLVVVREEVDRGCDRGRELVPDDTPNSGV